MPVGISLEAAADGVGMSGDVGIDNGAAAPVSVALEPGPDVEHRGADDLEAEKIGLAAAVSVVTAVVAVAVAVPAAPDAT